MALLDKMFVEIVCSDFVLEIIREDQIIEITVQSSDLFLIFFWRFWSHFDDLANSIDVVSEGQATKYFEKGNDEPFNIVGWNDLSEPNCRKNGGSPVPPYDVLIKIAVVVEIRAIQPHNRNVQRFFNSGH